MAGELQLVEGTLLVDGYNVIYSWPDLNRLKDEDMAHARDRLITIMSEFKAFTKAKIYVVFDAHQVKGGVEHHSTCGGVEVVFTKEGETADHWIERFAAIRRNQFPGSGALFVTTFDWMEQRVISALGAYRITPTELLQEVVRLKHEGRGLSKTPYDRDSLDSHLEGRVRQILEDWRRDKHDKQDES